MNSVFNANTANVAVYMVELAATWWLQSLILLLIGFLVASSLRRRGPAVQSVVYRVTLGAILLCPIASQLLTASGVSLFTIDLRSRQVAESTPASNEPTVAVDSKFGRLGLGGDTSLSDDSPPDLPAFPVLDEPIEFTDVDSSSTSESVDVAAIESTRFAGTSTEPSHTATEPTETVVVGSVVVLAIWLAGTLWFMGRISLDAFRTQRLRKRSAPSEELAEEVCREVASQLRVRTPQVLTTPFLSSPCLLGHWRPAVLVPEETDPATYYQLFLHELAHLDRGDWLWNLTGRFVHALLWFQPLVWFLLRRNAAAAEDVCDDYVLEYGCSREGYLQQLLEIAEKSVPQPAMGVSMVGFRSKLGRRAHRILDTSRVLSTRTSRLFSALALVVTLVATATVGTLVVGQARAVAADDVAGGPDVEVANHSESVNIVDAQASTRPEQAIDGRVLDTEGRPVAGVQLRVVYIISPQSDQAVEEWIKKAKPELFAGNKDFFDNSLRFTEFPHNRNFDGPEELMNATSDADGRFGFDGLAADQLVVLEASGRTIAKQYLSVVTREMKPLLAHPLTFEGTPDATHHGAKFTFVAQPTQPIIGTLTDIETSEPIAGVKIRVNVFAGSTIGQGDFLTAMTNDQGKFLIEGAPRGGGHRLSVDPAVDQPYFDSNFRVDKATQPGPIECAVAIRKTKWIVGRVTDEAGRPIKALVHYNPFLDNKTAELFPKKYKPGTMHSPRRRHPTDADGNFRIQAIAGRGVLTATVDGDREDTGEFTRGSSADVIEAAGGFRLDKTFNAFSADSFQSIQIVELAEDADEARYNIKLKRGEPVTLGILGPDNTPLTGARILGRTFPPFLEKEPQESRIEILGLRPGEERLVVLYHDAKKFGRTLTVRGGDAPHTVKLAPCTVVKGRFLDEYGEPVAHREIQVTPLDSEEGNAWKQDVEGTKTDDDGHFAAFLPPGSKQYMVTTKYSSVLPGFVLRVNPQVGAVYDLGDLRAGDKLDAADVAGRMARSSGPLKTHPVAIGATREASNEVTIKGTVLDPAGEPVSDASLLLVSTKQSAELLPTRKVLLRTKSDKAGRFAVNTKRQTGPNDPRIQGSLKILAIKPDWGAGWSAISTDELQSGRVRVELHEEKKISGRILDLEGRPLGGVRVAVAGLAAAKGAVDLDAWHAKAQENPTAVDHSYMMRAGDTGPEPYVRFPAQSGISLHGIDSLPTTATKPDGSFEIRGVARNHNATLAIAGKGVATTLIGVVAREMEAVNMPNPDSRFGTQKLYGANFDYAAHPSRMVRGRVVDKETKQALKGVLIRPTHTLNGANDTDKFLSDDEGRFEIPILPARGGLRLRVSADHIPYFRPADIEVPKSTGTGPIDLTIELERGEWIRGRLTNAETGDPITEGWVSYYPFFSNKRAEKLSHYRRDMMSVGYSDRVPISSDGTYRIVGVPGRGIVLCGATNAGIFKHGAGAERINGIFVKKGPRPRVYHLISVRLGNSVAEVDAKKGVGATCDIALEPLDRQRFTVIDGQQQPLTGYRVTGLLPSAMNVSNPHPALAPIRSEASFEVYGLADAAPRTLLLQHPERNLALGVEVTNSKKGSIKLLPAGTISGRVLATDGKPAAGAKVHLNYKAKQRKHSLMGANVQEELRERAVYFGTADVGADGTFSFDLIPPGVAYTVAITSEGGQRAKKEIGKVNAGQHVNLGRLSLAEPKQQQGGALFE